MNLEIKQVNEDYFQVKFLNKKLGSIKKVNADNNRFWYTKVYIGRNSITQQFDVETPFEDVLNNFNEAAQKYAEILKKKQANYEDKKRGHFLKHFSDKEYSIEEITNLFENTDDKYINLDGDRVKIKSQRIELFKEKGVKCVVCGKEGKYFKKDKHIASVSPHLNLYGLDESGNELLFTKDHIVPKSKGGEDTINNYQTMCYTCNVAKGDGRES